MYKIVIKGLAGESNINEKDRCELDGIDCGEVFSDYFNESYSIGDKIFPEEQCLIEKGVRGGYMKFVFENGVLNVKISYRSREELNDVELIMLKDYTQKQLSDGIGEEFEQESCLDYDDKEIYLSPWFFSQNLEVVQTKIEE